MNVVGAYNRKMSSHAYSFRAEPTASAAVLPRDMLESGEIKSSFGIAMATEQPMILKRKFAVRLDRLKSLGEFYKKQNLFMQMLMLLAY
jgi:hypothetical protein